MNHGSYTPSSGESDMIYNEIRSSAVPGLTTSIQAFGRQIAVLAFDGRRVRDRTGFNVQGAYDRQRDVIWMSTALTPGSEYNRVLIHELLHAAPFARPLTHDEIDSLIEEHEHVLGS